MAARKTNSTGSSTTKGPAKGPAKRPVKGTVKSSELMASLTSLALDFPGAWPDSPWGDSVVKVGSKIFVFLGDNAEDSSITVKVPESHEHAMSFEGAAPTGYGLGKAGWVTIPVGSVNRDDAEVLHDFVEESYRTIAPKRLVKELDAQRGADPSHPSAGE
jgi:predicted DNA-binding protein (MmcQ/YjbR family)